MSVKFTVGKHNNSSATNRLTSFEPLADQEAANTTAHHRRSSVNKFERRYLLLTAEEEHQRVERLASIDDNYTGENTVDAVGAEQEDNSLENRLVGEGRGEAPHEV